MTVLVGTLGTRLAPKPCSVFLEMECRAFTPVWADSKCVIALAGCQGGREICDTACLLITSFSALSLSSQLSGCCHCCCHLQLPVEKQGLDTEGGYMTLWKSVSPTGQECIAQCWAALGSLHHSPQAGSQLDQ